MKQCRNRILCGAMFLYAALLTGCTQDSIVGQETPNDGKTINTTFTLAPDFVEEINVRSLIGVDEKVIKDLWIVQLKADGTAQLQPPQYITTGFTSTGSDYKVSVALIREASKIYFIANTHNADLYKTATTATAVEAVSMTVNSEADLVSADGIPMAGVWTGTPDLLGIVGRVSLLRAAAKVNFKLNAALPYGESFTIKTVTVKQVPQTLSYYRDVATLGTYPYPATPVVKNYPATTYNEMLLSTPKTVSWYLSENARGMGVATIQTQKGSMFPTDQATYCTYIEVLGTYVCAGGWHTTTYRIYLGANNTNDYNLKRNTVYNVTTTIRGIDAADTRINITEIKPLDYTDNGGSSFVIAPEDSKNSANGTSAMNWYKANGVNDATNNPTSFNACPEGWRLPEKSEADLMWIYKPAIPEGEGKMSDIYWLATLSPSTPLTAAWYSNQSNGISVGGSKTTPYSVRCIRANTATTSKKYPYVDVNSEGKKSVIVSRDADGGVVLNGVLSSSEVTFLNTKPLVGYNEQSLYNKVSPKFEVAQSNANTVAYSWVDWMTGKGAGNDGSGCPTGWRMPNQRELILMMEMTLRGELTGVTTMITGEASANKYYMNSTESSQTPGSVWRLSSNLGHVNDSNKTDTFDYIRCIRDVN